MNKRASSVRKNEDIEVLRAIAILLVLVAHFVTLLPYDSALYAFVARNTEASVGVDLFFVISGFVITQSLTATALGSAQERKYLVQVFWIKRIFRLLPAAWLWLLIGALVYLVQGTLGQNYQPTVAAFLNVMNIYWSFCSPFGEASTVCSGNSHLNAHYWSLSLEEQFYLVYPLLFFFVNRRLLLVLLVGLIAIGLFWHRPIWTLGWFLRMDAIAWGVLLGLLCSRDFYSRPLALLKSNRSLLFLFYAAMVVLLPVVAEHVVSIRVQRTAVYGVGLIAFMSAVLVWLASYDLNLFTPSGRLKAVMLYFGARSYSLYLTHLVVFRVLHMVYTDHVEVEALAQHPVLVNAVMLGLGIAVAVATCEMTYRYVETPFRRRGRAIAGRILERRVGPSPVSAEMA